MSKINNKLNNFSNALKRLNEANINYKNDKSNSFSQDALIQRFEFTFELAWKALKEYLSEQGFQFTIGSPKSVLKLAYNEGIITDESIWLDILQDRNTTSHIYDEKMSAQIAENISLKYCKIFTELLNLIK